MKKFIAVIMIMVLSFVGTVVLYETGTIGRGKEVVANTATDTAYAVTAGATYRKFVETSDAQAAETGYTGVVSETYAIGDDEIEFSVHYINGARVSAIQYNNYTDGLITELQEKNEELGTFSGFMAHKLGLDK